MKPRPGSKCLVLNVDNANCANSAYGICCVHGASGPDGAYDAGSVGMSRGTVCRSNHLQAMTIMVSSPSAAGPLRASRTDRNDWDTLIDELYASVISGTSFGIGIASKSKGFLGASMKLRLNQRFPSPAIPQYIRKQFQVAKLDNLFQSANGLQGGPGGLYKVTGEGVGLPRNCLVFPYENPSDKNLRGVILFGGERMEGQLEKRIQAAIEVLEGSGRSSPRGGLALDSRDQLVASLSKINVKRLFEYDMDLLARIVNGLEETKEDLPKNLKPVFHSVSEYILKQRLKRGR